MIPITVYYFLRNMYIILKNLNFFLKFIFKGNFNQKSLLVGFC